MSFHEAAELWTMARNVAIAGAANPNGGVGPPRDILPP
jgi:hypothetical protein